MGGIAIRTSRDPPRCAYLQAPVFDRVVRRGTGADDVVSSVVRARHGGPWRAGPPHHTQDNSDSSGLVHSEGRDLPDYADPHL